MTKGYRDLLDFVTKEYLPACRQQVGAAALPRGREFYRYRVRHFTTLDVEPEHVHEIGQEEVRRIKTEMEAAIKRTGFQGDFQFVRRIPPHRSAVLCGHARAAAARGEPGAEADGRRAAQTIQDAAAHALWRTRDPGLRRAANHDSLLHAAGRRRTRGPVSIM